MIRKREITPVPKDSLTTQISDLGKMARAGVMGSAGPGLMGTQTVLGMVVTVDPMHAMRQKWGRGSGARGPARWA